MHPNALRDQYSADEGYIKSSLGNFGHIQYGSTILGQVIYPENNKQGCLPFSKDDFKQLNGSDHSNLDHSQIKPIIMVDRGLCTFVKKVRNIEDFGVKLAIIADDRDEYSENLIMADDGNGHSITIPSFIIYKKDADKIKDYLKKEQESHQHQTNQTNQEDSNAFTVVIRADLEIAHSSNRVEYEMFYSSVLDLEHYFLEDMIQYQQAFGNNTVFTPRIASFHCKDCSKVMTQYDCIYDGMYCPLQSFTDISLQLMDVPRADVMEESLREKCLFDGLQRRLKGTKQENQANLLFFQYLLAFQDQCFSKELFGEKCSLDAMYQVGIVWASEIAECVNSSTLVTDFMNKQISVNTFLQADRKRRDELGLVINPGFVINNMTYRGDIEATDIFRAVCAGFSTKPEICRSQNFAKIDGTEFGNGDQQVNVHSEDHIKINHVYAMVFVVLMINVGLLCLYRIYHKQKVKTHLNMHVNSAVSQYFKISSNDSFTN
eukprot:403376411